ncbi:molecular chaperone [Pseudomonas sp. FW215-R2]|uniref:molecular chaperone n=1 Tax=unclassified Pseudomonas TaxID=196821 RepID=UPI000C88E85D|nr:MULTISPECIES: molecular chaperone [unclassified Pseudomonas]PMX02775.1 molecular chaperone [Pseudomonas sp. FW215-R2]PMX11517.1 molecular chaperone [Pseudomonas sp. FW215-L1]PMX23701.1 molecular chaperone [Pseudomonas sp. FW215-E1]PNA32136.1 molecular chaperone [Pseudomonas sp. FW215-R4]
MSEPRSQPPLSAPTPTQLRLSFCEATPRDLKRWIAGLPKANIGETARQLYQGLGELNQLLTPSDNRLHLLELLRPEVYFVCQHLERHFLHQAIMLDERSRKISNLCQALQSQLAIGYKQIVLRIAPKYTKDRATLLSEALQRATHALKGQLVRATQLYSPAPEQLWFELHQLFRCACDLQLQHRRVRDDLASLAGELSVEQTYIAALLLGSARCNQLRQNPIAQLAQVLEPWSAWLKLHPGASGEGLFAISAEIDAGPRYRSKFRSEQQPGLLGFDPQPLVDAIEAHLLHQDTSTPLPVPAGLTLDTLQHLHATWGEAAERSFQRTVGQGNLTVCVGMSALHFYLGGERTFSELLRHPGSRAANFSRAVAQGEKDSWSQAFDAAPQSKSDEFLPYEEIRYEPLADDEGDADSPPHYPTYALPVINHSPGGYCLAWPKEVPAELQTGEMVGIQDTTNQGWSIAVVRWIRQVRGAGTQMGIELVAPHAQPCGLQLVRTRDDHSHYLRGLLLPEISAIDLPATLLAPRLPFQEGSKVMINTQGEEHRAGLDRRVASTHSFNQFAYRSLEAAQNGGSEEDFDSLWKSL